MAVNMENVVIPIDLSAFVLTPECANDSGPSRIAPIVQPNYVGLRLDEALMQHDLVDHIDFHDTTPANLNPRLTDIGATSFDANPPNYRRNRMGNPNRPPGVRSDTEADDTSIPTFPSVPNRWLVVRRLNSQTSEHGDDVTLPTFQSWIVESNRVRKAQVIDEKVDLEVDVSPFMRADNQPDDPDWKHILERQAEVFIGKRNEYSGWSLNSGDLWTEKETSDNTDDFLDLTVLGSSNPVFADYVPHNGGVFSIVDSFSYKDAGGRTKHLTNANADYFVIGWNSLAEKDLLNPLTPTQLKETLDNLKLKLLLPEEKDDPTERSRLQEILNLEQNSRSILHGAIYSVSFSWGTKPPSQAEAVAGKFGPKFTMEPLSVGVTPIDGIMTFLRAHQNDKDLAQLFGNEGADDIASMVLTLGDLLYAANDTYNERVKAQDINMYEGYYGKSTSAGYRWEFAGTAESGQPPKIPTDGQFTQLLSLNEKQIRLDALDRKLEQKRWDLFAEWWKYVSDKKNVLEHNQNAFSKRVSHLKRDIHDLENKAANDLRTDLLAAKDNKSFKRVTQGSFYMRREPTLCIAGMDSGWPADFMDALPIRLDHQIATSQASRVFDSSTTPFPNVLEGTALKILGECVGRTKDDFGEGHKAVKGYQYWGNRNPFQPMFVEWEALYYHIDRSKWNVGVRPSPVGLPNSEIRYGVSELLAKNTEENQKDYRYIRGRSLILPQPVFSLQATVQAVVDNNGPASPLDGASIDTLLKGIGKLPFISCPLSGLQEHLLTRVIGTHVKPTVNKPGKTNIPLKPAIQSDIGINEEDLKLIDTRSDLTPYGNLMAFPPNNYPNPPFKGVTHGQMMITKLNIIDKFGQAVALPTPPTKKLKTPPTIADSVHPCLSEFLTPDIFEDQINTIFPEDKQPDHGSWPLCRFMQLSPSINQNARVNTCFVNRACNINSADLENPILRNAAPFWAETENDKPQTPIFGWIVINYQDSGLQFFRPDGRFYREVRVGGPTGKSVGSKWLPFDPPSGADKNTGNAQLDKLIEKLAGKDDKGQFLTSFFHMINGAIKTMPFPPSEYSAYSNALVGKPLALVNVGFSLELAIPALTAQNTLGKTPASEGVSEEALLSSYQFPFKIGDVDRPFDGVVGYFETDNKTNGETNWDKMYTYFPDPDNQSFVQIEPTNFPRLSPNYIDPLALTSTSTGDTTFESYRQAQAAQFSVLTLLIDPYTPIHAYSPILPISSLAVPPWTIQQAFTRMTAFFRFGPSLLSTDVRSEYDRNRPLQTDSWTVPLPDGGASNDKLPMPAIRLPISGKKGLWRWLQPYDVKGEADTDPHDTLYNEFDVNQETTAIRKDRPPYTFVEGYLQLARPILDKDVTGVAGIGR
ncbi:hypothetical protein E8E13_000317 [Curvularia kusanoi]|uniref:Uncharacterized protein n=1 Tax=Curvularia kusanoi TaxID=90978 RepID=A0A9P4T4B3_CURKU|nr:hypothetical protein E8E13_000317 [Curvularia kusanoi]